MATKKFTAKQIKDLTIEDIIEFCQNEGPTAIKWLKKTAAKTTIYKAYPRVKVDGKWVVDKSQEPKISKRPISFVQLKQEFLTEFNLKEAPAEKKPSFHDMIAAL